MNKKENYDSVTAFVSQNIAEVKSMLSFSGYNDLSKRLSDIARMTRCHAVSLCAKVSGQNTYVIIESSNPSCCKKETKFTWQHSQPASSTDAQNTIDALPFDITKNTGVSFISVPIKNSRNIVVGLMLGIATERLSDIDDKTQLMHILASSMEPEIRCYKLRRDAAQYETRIASLNQDLEVVTNDLRHEHETSMASQEFKSIFLTNLSQEIRTPMNDILGFSDLLGQTTDPADRRKFISFIKMSGHRLLDVIDNLIEISKLQSNFMLKVACPVQLNVLLDNLKSKYEEVLRKSGKNVVIETSYGLEAPNDTIWRSDEIITKAMDNILDNACRYTQTGRILMSYTFNHREATFCITDTGPGIKPGTENSIFNMFNMDFGSIDEGEGDEEHKVKGIGLAVAKEYVMLAGGKIWVDMSYRDGACFYFTIPADKL